jgi:hypothetical protein
LWSLSSVHHGTHFWSGFSSGRSARIVAGRIQQGRQDLNLQPAVLETAALPVELRPFAGWQANLLVPGFPLCAAPPHRFALHRRRRAQRARSAPVRLKKTRW